MKIPLHFVSGRKTSKSKFLGDDENKRTKNDNKNSPLSV